VKELQVVTEIALACRDLGGRALIVGGWVRDSICGFDSKDIDVEVYSLPPQTVREVLSGFGEVDEVGEAFGVLRLKGLDIDVSMPRRDSKKGLGHKGFTVECDSSLTVREAASRRDFTMNSMAFDPLTQELLDPFNGSVDMLNGVLRITNVEHFVEDPLRLLRAAQFIARFNLVPTEELLQVCTNISSSLQELAPERHLAEWGKLLMRGVRPSVGLEFLRKIRALPPELEALIGLQQDAQWHPEGDVWTHTLMAVDELAQRQDKTLALMFGILLHDLGKATTTTFEEDGHIRSKGHPEEGVPLVHSFMSRIKASKLLTEQVAMLVETHLAPVSHREASRQGFNRLARKLGTVGLSLIDVELVARADHFGRTTQDALLRECPNGDVFLAKAQECKVAEKALPDVVMGRHLIMHGFTPGPQFGEILRLCRDAQDETGSQDAEEILQKVLEMLPCSCNSEKDVEHLITKVKDSQRRGHNV
jgi:tRNA nucleotidyltransferase (CCA-adding enzyme)